MDEIQGQINELLQKFRPYKKMKSDQRIQILTECKNQLDEFYENFEKRLVGSKQVYRDW